MRNYIIKTTKLHDIETRKTKIKVIRIIFNIIQILENKIRKYYNMQLHTKIDFIVIF